MTDVLAITAPIYILIGVGYALTRLGLFDVTHWRALGRYALMVGMPCLLFDALSRRRMAELLHGGYMLNYAVASLVVFGLGYVWARHRRASGSLAAMSALGMSSSNTGYVGLPIVARLLGDTGTVGVALAFLVENLLVMPLAFALADQAQRAAAARLGDAPAAWTQSVRATLLGLLRNPLLLAILAGLVASLVELRLPEVVQRSVSMVAASATPVALLVIGGSLVGLKLDGVRLDLGAISLGKLVLHPLAVLLMFWLLPIEDARLRLCGVVLAAMPMLGIYPVLAQRYGHERFCAAALLVTTIASFATINAILWVLSATL